MSLEEKEVSYNGAEETSNFVSERIPGEIEGASIARTLVSRESLANVNTFKTISQSGKKVDVPVSSVEYYADCDNDGDFFWLVVDIGSSYQNIISGSKYSFSIRVGDHHIHEDVNLEYPGGIVDSPAGSPRIILQGELQDVEDKDGKYGSLEECFLKRHPDSKMWIPNKSQSHKSHWAKFIVDDLYMVGGFGDRAFIGTIDTGIYHSVTSLDDH
ncbi:hypothetical protein PSN45_004861 [Yamadazyma tenuis]|nr:hypothetical protein PSN45_004861 [Yamadazyma tenuis]